MPLVGWMASTTWLKGGMFWSLRRNARAKLRCRPAPARSLWYQAYAGRKEAAFAAMWISYPVLTNTGSNLSQGLAVSPERRRDPH